VSIDPQVLMQGLSISISGMTITFLALGVFIFIMLGLQKLFPSRPDTINNEAPSEPEPCAPIEVSEDEEVAVAIAAAVSFLRAKGQQSLGKNLEYGPGPLWSIRKISSASPAVRSNRS
jgi:sodium pump decarboxylase gamma subunit